MIIRKIKNRYIRYAFKIKDSIKNLYAKRKLDYADNLYIYTDTLREFNTRANSAQKEPEMIDWIEGNSGKYSTMYDIGANIGAYSLVAAQNNLNVFAFEPAYQNFFQLNNNVTLNNFDGKIKTFPVAFSSETKIEDFNYIESSIGTSKCFYNEENKYHLNESVKIKKSMMIFSLDDFIDLFRLPIPEMLKIDVDGGEFDILKGAPKTLQRKELRELIIEIDDHLNSIKEIESYLAQFGYQFVQSFHRDTEVYNCLFTRID